VVQEEWIAEWETERAKCPQCGRDRDECSDPDVDWYPQRSICWATVAQRVAIRHYNELHAEEPYHDGSFLNSAKSYSRQTPFRFDDGVTIWVSRQDLTPDDDFLAQG
jgi:hypothetical protein